MFDNSGLFDFVGERKEEAETLLKVQLYQLFKNNQNRKKLTR